MKKNTLVLLCTTILFSLNTLSSQVMLRKTSLKQQIEASSLVVEGKIISKKSFWSDNFIYTANTVEVYKVFKGEPRRFVNLITKGGTVGLSALNVSSSLKLNTGDIGLFTLEGTNITSNKEKQFKPYGAIQGFYKYNLNDDVAVNPFNSKKGISDSFYPEIMTHTKIKYIEIENFDIKAIQAKSAQGKSLLAPSAITFTPTTTTAGTKSTITITIPSGNTGSDFGNTKGKVSFANADDGGATFIDALSSQVTWSSSSITVEVPSNAGTGKIIVVNADDSSRESTIDLTIEYAETNVIYDEDDLSADGGSNGPLEPKAYRVQHFNENGSGGYTWQMHNDFNANTLAKEAFERAFETWRCTTKINWTIGSPTSVDEAVFESAPVPSPGTSAPSVNVVRFDNGFELDTDVLGTCYSWYKGCSLGGGNFAWFVGEMDVVFDDTTNWNFGPASTTTFGEFDFESVALHELGHGHQLSHVIDDTNNGDNMDDVMHYALQFNEDQRVLSAGNVTAAGNVQARSTGSQVCSRPLMTNYSNSCTLEVEEAELNEGVNIYPIPTKGNLYISNEGLLNIEKITMYDLSGRLILQQGISSTSRLNRVDLNSTSKGIYFLNIHSGKTFITKKIVVE